MADRGARVNSGRLYIPTPSHVYSSHGTADDVAVTLSIHNVSVERELVLDEVNYYSTSGQLIQKHLEKPMVLAPLQTVEYFVPTRDRRGGSGANFVVGWSADSPVAQPLVEAVMVFTEGPRGFAFVNRGVAINADATLPTDAQPNPSPEDVRPGTDETGG